MWEILIGSTLDIKIERNGSFDMRFIDNTSI